MNQLLAMRALVRVVDTGSFTRAADQLSLPRSTVSKLVADLEHHLGATLVQRTTRQVTVTPEGLVYHEYAVRLLAELDEADNAVRGHGLRPRGRLRVDVPATIAHHLLIPALPEFADLYPEITVSVGVGDRQVNIIGEGVDCVIRGGNLGDPALIARKLMDLRQGTYASLDYVARYGTPESPEAIVGTHRVVGYFSPNTERLLPLVFEKGEQRIEITEAAFAANDGEAQIAMIRAGLGIGQHFAPFVQPLVDEGELVEILPDWQRTAFPLYVVYPPARLRSARLVVFIEWLLQRFSSHVVHADNTSRKF